MSLWGPFLAPNIKKKSNLTQGRPQTTSVNNSWLVGISEVHVSTTSNKRDTYVITYGLLACECRQISGCCRSRRRVVIMIWNSLYWQLTFTDIEIERTTQDGKQWSRRYFLACYLPSNFIGKHSVRAKSQIRFCTRLTRVRTGRENKQVIFYSL